MVAAFGRGWTSGWPQFFDLLGFPEAILECTANPAAWRAFFRLTFFDWTQMPNSEKASVLSENRSLESRAGKIGGALGEIPIAVRVSKVI
jgi:hypothetical protein